MQRLPPPRPTHTHTPVPPTHPLPRWPHPSACHWLAGLRKGRRHSLHSLPFGWFYCLSDCVTHVYCLFLLWNEVAFLPSFYQSIAPPPFFFLSYITTLCETAGPLAEWRKTVWNVEWGIGETDTEFRGVEEGKKKKKKKFCCSSHFSLLDALRTSSLVSASSVVRS